MYEIGPSSGSGKNTASSGSLILARGPELQHNIVVAVALELDWQLDGFACTRGQRDRLLRRGLFRAVVARGGELQFDGLRRLRGVLQLDGVTRLGRCGPDVTHL